MTTPAGRDGHDYDLVILGGGSAGIVAGVMAGGLGLRVLLLEKYRMGGECLNTGCVPSKALLHAARTAHTLRTGAAAVGLPVREIDRATTRPVLEWVRSTIAAVGNADASEKLLRDNGVTVRFGDARFEDAHTLRFRSGDAEERITAAHFLIATGSHPAVPQGVPGLAESPYRTNQTIFDLEEIPERLLIVGGGPVGVEMAQAFQRLGSQVTLLQQGERLLPRDDRELVDLLTEQLRAEGVRVHCSARLERVENGTATVTVKNGPPEAIPFDCLLLAAGRAPNIEGLGLEAVGVDTSEEGIVVNDHLRTTVPTIYACGDVTDTGYRFSHLAEYQAKIAVRNIVFPGESGADYHAAPWATFTEPELAHIGLTEAEALAQGVAHDVYRQPFAQNDRAITDGDAALPGLVKVLVAPGIGGRVLGVQILGPRAGELLQEWILAMQPGHSIRTIADLVHVYPTLSMANQHVAQRWYERQAQDPTVHKALEVYIRKIRPHEKALAVGAVGLGLATAVALLLQNRSKK